VTTAFYKISIKIKIKKTKVFWKNASIIVTIIADKILFFSDVLIDETIPPNYLMIFKKNNLFTCKIKRRLFL